MDERDSSCASHHRKYESLVSAFGRANANRCTVFTVMVFFPLWEIYSSEKIAKLCPPAMFRNVRGFCVPLSACFLGGMMVRAYDTLGLARAV